MIYSKHSQVTLQCLALALFLAASPALVHAEKESSIKEFLSDPQRVGSLTGTIIGGALTAHPAGAAAGTLIGFFAGKPFMLETEEQKQIKKSRYAAASIVPIANNNETQQTLSFNSEAQSDGVALSSTETIVLDDADQDPQTILLGAYIEEAPSEQDLNTTIMTEDMTEPDVYNADMPLDNNADFFTPEATQREEEPQHPAEHCYRGNRANISPRQQAMCYYYSG